MSLLKNGVLFYCFKSYFVVKRIFLSFIFYFLKEIGSALKPFSPLHSQLKSPQKKRVQKKKGFKKIP
ncbi:hypothetical protein C2S19_00375 [Helicobacter pylori]|nr:hypothetical protein C2S19_00375 [Helicobacter pylori]